VRRLIAVAILGGLLAGAMVVLYELGRRGLDAEAARLQASAERGRVQALEAVRDSVAAALEELRRQESERPYYHYKALYAPPDLVANSLALVPSPLVQAPRNGLITLYFEVRGGVFDSPALFKPATSLQRANADLNLPNPNREYQLLCDYNLKGLAKSQELRAKLKAPPRRAPARVGNMDRYVAWANENEIETLTNFQGCSPAELASAWDQSQRRVGKRSGMYGVANPAGADAVIVREFPVEWVSGPADSEGWPSHLVAVRRIEVGERSWNQGFLLDLARVREGVVEPAIAQSLQRTSIRSPLTSALDRRRGARAHHLLEVVATDQAGDVGVRLRAPLAGLALIDRTPPFSTDAALSESRFLLDGALLLAVFVLAAGSLLLILAAREERRLAQRRSDFVAALTHELKAPLTGLRALAEMLHEGMVPDEGKKQEYYASMLDESERLSRLVQNVLDAARLERGTLEAMPERFAPGPLLVETTERFRARLEAQDFRLEIDLGDDELPDVRVDREAFVQIVANLIDNAAKYGRGADARIEVRARVEAKNVVVCVADRGPGVPAAERESIFDRFVRSDGAPREVGGAGLGLAIARAHARAQGGDLRVTDAPVGACFCLSIPVAEPA
jgi:signal transduction histidine kinase